MNRRAPRLGAGGIRLTRDREWLQVSA
jgi:hypothetical protein